MYAHANYLTQRLLDRLKREIAGARVRAALAVNEQLIGLYWRIGAEILSRQQGEGWGAKVTARLSNDLRQEFPEMKGHTTSRPAATSVRDER